MNTMSQEISGVFFDTHATVKKLKRAGFSEMQAETQTEILSDLIRDELATKRDLKELETRLMAEIHKVKAEIHKVKAETVKWMLTSSLAQAGLIGAPLKLLYTALAMITRLF